MKAPGVSWPTVAFLMFAIAAIVATLLAGPALGLEAETLKFALSGEGLIAAIVLGFMRGLREGASMLLAFVLAGSLAIALPACTTVANAGPAVLKARDLTCSGTRIVARVVDRACRVSGGPWVVPQSDEERAEWRAMSGGDDEAPGPTSGDESGGEAEGQ